MKPGLAILLLNIKQSQAWLGIIKCNIVNVNMCNLQLIHTIQPAKCYYNTMYSLLLLSRNKSVTKKSILINKEIKWQYFTIKLYMAH